MAIGLLAFGFAGLCAVVAMIGSAFPQDKSRQAATDYRKIYAATLPREL